MQQGTMSQRYRLCSQLFMHSGTSAVQSELVAIHRQVSQRMDRTRLDTYRHNLGSKGTRQSQPEHTAAPGKPIYPLPVPVRRNVSVPYVRFSTACMNSSVTDVTQESISDRSLHCSLVLLDASKDWSVIITHIQMMTTTMVLVPVMRLLKLILIGNRSAVCYSDVYRLSHSRLDPCTAPMHSLPSISCPLVPIPTQPTQHILPMPGRHTYRQQRAFNENNLQSSSQVQVMRATNPPQRLMRYTWTQPWTRRQMTPAGHQRTRQATPAAAAAAWVIPRNPQSRQ